MLIAVCGDGGGCGGHDTFICFRIEGGQVCERNEYSRAPGDVAAAAGQLAALEVDLLIAGNVGRDFERALFECGVKLISGVSGCPDALAAAYLDGSLNFRSNPGF